MLSKVILSVAAATVLCAAAPAPSVTIDGTFAKAQTVDADAVASMPHETITVVEEHSKTPAQYSGVTLAALLASAGVPVGADVKGPPAHSYVVVHASDGYAGVFSLAELQSTATNCAPLFADRRNGQPMDPVRGPFRIIAPCDLTHARWVSGVTGFTIVTVPDTKQGK